MRTNLRLVVATATAAALTGGLLGLSAGTVAAAPAKHADDFNGDGHRDYASFETPGSVVVTYGTADGPGRESETFDQNSPGIPGTRAAGGDAFGDVRANADFNNDGYADLAVSDPEEKVGKHKGRGLVVIMWGSKSGLGAKAASLALKTSYARQGLGRHLAAGDFDGNGKADLAVADQKSVHVFRGGFSSKNGGTGKVTRHQHRDQLEVTGLAAGKVTKDRAADLYVFGAAADGSNTWFLRGGSTVKAAKKPTAYNASHAAREGVVADFDKDGYGDLAIGDFADKGFTGAVRVVRGGKNGPGSTYRLTQSTAGIATGAAKHDGFGFSLSAGDTDRDGYQDLAVGATERIGSVEGAGGVHILRGGKKGLTGAGSQWFTRATAGIPGEPRSNGLFGTDVRLRDLDRDGDIDLLVTDQGWNSVRLDGETSGITARSAYELRMLANFPQ
ncbi:FG-GAP and VCBS repeat-containing protein [Streptomyces sp. NPDC014894]|uniref:FG-GAP and VCBS repeat-containing protein n=1 Tax=unclassified Streptomyces TaxID=2593676 RepID=UPI00370142BA